MADIPGRVGWPLLGDKSLEFAKDPIKFFQKYKEETNSVIFATRFLNKPTVFVGSNAGVAQILQETVDLELGYKAYMEQMYGDNIIFANGEIADHLRTCLCQLFTEDCLCSYTTTVHSIMKYAMENLDHSKPVPVYTLFKQLATEICLSIFLGLNMQEANSYTDAIVSLTTTHWHGIISVPLSLKIPGTENATSYSKALVAKKKLLELIVSKRKNKKHFFMDKMEQALSFDEIHINHHLLLFISALLPKALASLLTSLCIEISRDDKVSLQSELLLKPDILDNLYLEVQRLYPPFIGGRRVAKKNLTVDGYKVPKGHGVVFMTYAAHRDESVFPNSDEFCPDRWKDCSCDSRRNLFCFGGGPRCCVGEKLVDCIVKTIITKLLSTFSLQLLPGQDLEYKWLPVSRPKEEVFCSFQKKIEEDDVKGLYCGCRD
ncbi:putative cytochrome P450 120 [Gigantopelta aegis]|uniref:putative cytochrome P450 120 n=1 Tax=Gigantopelta aegis TaxID=1735272 RepID=UPI001B88DA17|nr:putative cytochrome P450 120 [Gigantopelta aegis]XP_041368100.1 putative cytochrome P450 120 [Gigantopelta aegis]XP_041368101.1 putative cytochrome P450 120 [Gigantopelta aegis]